ncbi:octopamine receptor-like [Lytechinus pictus]|uniref:octopamine receptor-like n=1 Tax=Lytechinus pictus TaxID=7653 RepID=UPI0030B9DE40
METPSDPTEPSSVLMTTWTAFKITIYVVIMLTAIIGNSMVFIAIGSFQNLRTVSNQFVLSLATSDFVVSLVILPFSVQEAYYSKWYLGDVLCRFWLACDVLFVTISIFNLAAISIDRYRSIKNPLKYSLKRTNRMAYKHIAVAWLLSLLVGVPPFYFSAYHDNSCYLRLYPYFIIPATTIGFFLPLAIVIFTHIRIFWIAKKHASRVSHGPGTVSEGTRSDPNRRKESTGKRATSLAVAETKASGSRILNEDASIAARPTPSGLHQPEFGKPISNKISVARERKAARTVAIVIGVFTVCWMPFFVAVSAASVCPSCDPQQFHLQVLTFIGYANSAANPIIYTIFNKEFRQAFKKILHCKFR